jgi:hypothetical protein
MTLSPGGSHVFANLGSGGEQAGHVAPAGHGRAPEAELQTHVLAHPGTNVIIHLCP